MKEMSVVAPLCAKKFPSCRAWELAPPARLELTTLRLGGARSIQVSYGGISSGILQ